jgi:hypothetical protein
MYGLPNWCALDSTKRGVFAFGMAGVISASVLSAPALAESETRPLAGFSKVQMSTGVSGTINCGAPARAVVTADSPAGLQRLKTEIDGSTLTVRFRGMGSWSGSVSVVITTPGPLDTIETSSGSSLKVEGCAISPTQLGLQASSGSSLNVVGKTSKLNVHASSGASIDANALITDETLLEASSGASINACKAHNVTGRASSGASINSARGSTTRVETSSGASYSDEGCR